MFFGLCVCSHIYNYKHNYNYNYKMEALTFNYNLSRIPESHLVWETLSVDPNLESITSDQLDRLWISMGKETCNIKNWTSSCFYILQNSFGKTKFAALSSTRQKIHEKISNDMDTLVGMYYPRDIYEIHVDGKEHMITDIFYFNEDIQKARIDHSVHKKKCITRSDQQYILKYFERIAIYFDYLDAIIDKLVGHIAERYVHSANKKKQCVKRIRSAMKTITKKYDKLKQEIENIAILEEETY